MRLLIVEDEPKTVDYLKKGLTEHGDDWCAVLAWGTLGRRSIATSVAVPVVLAVALNRSSTNLMLDPDHVYPAVSTAPQTTLSFVPATGDLAAANAVPVANSDARCRTAPGVLACA